MHCDAPGSFAELIHAEHGPNVDGVITWIVGLAAIDNPYHAAKEEDLSALPCRRGSWQDAHGQDDAAFSQSDHHLWQSRHGWHSRRQRARARPVAPGARADDAQPIGGGEALIPSSVKVAAAGAPIDIPLSHKDNPWSFGADPVSLTP